MLWALAQQRVSFPSISHRPFAANKTPLRHLGQVPKPTATRSASIPFTPESTPPDKASVPKYRTPKRDLFPVAMDQLSVIEQSKRLAAYTAVDKHILPHHKIIGIGSGSTVPYVVERIVQQGAELNKERIFIPTGFQSKELIISSHLNLGDLDQFITIDVTIDGADEVDPQLNCIKGGGACHLREKVIAEAANLFVVVADYRKNSEYLGENFSQGVPIEVVPFAYAKVLRDLHKVLGSPNASLRMAKAKAGPVVTDNGNFVIDAPFTRDLIQHPGLLSAKIKVLTGVVEVGLFCNIARVAYFGNQDGSVTVKKTEGSKVIEERITAP